MDVIRQLIHHIQKRFLYCLELNRGNAKVNYEKYSILSRFTLDILLNLLNAQIHC